MSDSFHQPQEVLLSQFSLYVQKGGLKACSFNFISEEHSLVWVTEARTVESTTNGSNPLGPTAFKDGNNKT